MIEHVCNDSKKKSTNIIQCNKSYALAKRAETRKQEQAQVKNGHPELSAVQQHALESQTIDWNLKINARAKKQELNELKKLC